MSWSHAGLSSGDRSSVPTYPTEAADGTPHLTYFADNVSFVWSGNIEHPIQVCSGGYGEDVTDRIEIPHDFTMLGLNGASLPQLLRTFRRVCHTWLTEQEN